MVHDVRPKPYFAVEGNIGAGKSTFLKVIARYLNAQFVPEPLEQWQNVGGENLLERFYADTQRWSYTFQTYAFVTRIVMQEAEAKKNELSYQIVERSVFSDRFCFAKNAYELGLMSALEWKLYQEWFAWLVEGYMKKPSGFIYLRTDAQVCYERMLKRSRSDEASVHFDYIHMLHKRHEDWLIHRKEDTAFLHDVPVLVLECNEDFENNESVQKEHIQKIVDFLETNFNIPREKSLNSLIL